MEIAEVLVLLLIVFIFSNVLIFLRSGVDRRERIVLVTGAANGLGRSASELLAVRGDTVIAIDLDFAAVDAAASEINGVIGHKRVFAFSADVRDVSTLLDVKEKVKEEFGFVSCIVNFAGLSKIGPLVEIGKEVFDLVLDVNVKGPFNVVQTFFPILECEDYENPLSCRIVNACSEVSAAFLSTAFTAPYAMSKFALEAYTVSLRQEMSLLPTSKGERVDVIAINPGAMETNMVMEQFSSRRSPWLLAAAKEGTLWKRQLLQGEKIAQNYMHRHKRPPILVAEAVWKLLHWKYPPNRLRVNNSLEMRLGALLPQSFHDFVILQTLK